MAKFSSWLRSPVGFIASTAAALAGVAWLTGLIGIESAGETARYFGFIYALVGGLHLKVLSELYGLRDVDALGRDERLALREIVTSQAGRIWALLAILLALALIGVFSRSFASFVGNPIVWMAWLGVWWAFYSLLLVASWHQEIAEFKSRMFERKRCLDRNREDLDALRKDKKEDWPKAEKLNQFTDDPPPNNHTLCA